MMRIFQLVLVFGVLAGAVHGQQILEEDNLASSRPSQAYVPGEFLAQFKSHVPDHAIRLLNSAHGVAVAEFSRAGRFYRLRGPKNKTVEEIVGIYRKNPQVEYAEPNYIAAAHAVPNDPLYGYQWHLHAGNGGMGMESAWDITPGGSSGVIVAVVDAGVAYEDYAGTYHRAPDLSGTAFVPGYDFHNNDAHPNDDNGHGTHVAGTIAQTTNNGTGVAGVAYNVRVMPVKVLGADGSGSYDNIAKGIYFAADNGAQVVNMSLGGSYNATTLRNAVAYAYSKGVTLVASAGNDGNKPVVNYPAAYNDYVIAVAATRFDGLRAPYSTKGSYVDIAAPGGDLRVDQNRDGYGDGVLQQTFETGKYGIFSYYFYQGTSMAAPHAAGLAALLVSQGTTDPTKVREALQKSARDRGTSGWDSEYGWGLIDAAAALRYFPSPRHDVAVTGIAAPSQAETNTLVSVAVTVANEGDYSESFTLTLTNVTGNEQVSAETVQNLAPGTSTTLGFSWTSGAVEGSYVLEAQAALAQDQESSDNTRQHVIEVKSPVHDLAVTGISAPSSVSLNSAVAVTVTVGNSGTFTENSTVVLRDSLVFGIDIGSGPVALGPGGTTASAFTWTPDRTGDHVLVAYLNQVEGDVNTDNDTLRLPVSVVQTETMSIGSVDVAGESRSAGPNAFKSAKATVTVLAGDGNPVPGAVVYGQWSGAAANSDVGTTDANGQVVLSSAEVKSKTVQTFTLTVTDVQKSGYVYDPSLNTETSDSATH